MQAAVFSDLEGTLIDANLPEMAMAIGRDIFTLSPVQRFQLRVISLAQKVLPRKLRRTLQLLKFMVAMPGQTPAQLQTVNIQFIPAILQKIKPSMLDQLRRHQQSGLPLVLISAGLHEAVSALGIALDGRGEGTKFVLENGRYRAKLSGGVCQGIGKAQRASAVIAEMNIDPVQSYAYGDTANDIPYLELFGHPHAVDPDPELAAHATQKGWPIILTR